MASSAHWNEDDGFKGRVDVEKCLHARPDGVEARLAPRHGVHLVHDHHQPRQPQPLQQHGVLARLRVRQEARLELALGRGHHEEARVRLARARDHVGHKVAMAGGVQQHHAPVRSLEALHAHVNRDAARALLRVLVQHPRVLERRLAHVARVLFKRVHVLLRDELQVVQQVAHQGRLACVDVAGHHEAHDGLALSVQRIVLFIALRRSLGGRFRCRWSRWSRWRR